MLIRSQIMDSLGPGLPESGGENFPGVTVVQPHWRNRADPHPKLGLDVKSDEPHTRC